MDTAARALSGAGARVLRGMVHLRPDGSYEGLAVREAGGHAGDAQGTGRMPSTTAWRWVEDTRDAVLLDVRAGTARDGSGAALAGEARQRPDFGSRSTLLGREAALVAALPLRRPGGRVDGFVSLELAAGDAADGAADGGLDGWPVLACELQTLVDVAASFVCELPREPREVLRGEEGLPVVGARMRSRIEDLRLFAAEDETILLQGETGVGKNRLAHWCWKQSPRADGPFLRVNLTEVSEDLREGILFGWLKGMFTGAVDRKVGLVEKAEGGTLFIDEIDKLSLEGQAILLSLLDEGRFRVIGKTDEQAADIRFIVGTNANLEQAKREGRFHKDLYYRIRRMPVHVPPLRQRRDEIVAWAEYFIAGMHKKKRPGEARLEAAAGRLLEAQDWPGNLRQLRSVVVRAYIFARPDALDGDVWVRVSHVARALVDEGGPELEDLREALERAAAELVNHALASDSGLDLDHAGALRHFVLAEAVARVGRRDGFALVGRDKSLRSGNGAKILDKERELWHALVRALGHEPGKGPGRD